MPGTISAGGNFLYSWGVALNITPTSVGSNTTSEQAFTVQGVQVSDNVSIYYWGTASPPTPAPQTVGIGIANCRVSAANTLQVGFSNSTGSPATPAAGLYYLWVSRPETAFQLLPATAA